MGRWAQKSRRGGSQDLNTVTLLSVQFLAAGSVRLNFDKLVLVIDGPHTGDITFQANGGGSNAVSAVGSNFFTLSVPAASAAGQTWVLNSQPPWLKNRTIVPQNGVMF